MASEVKPDVRFEISDPRNPWDQSFRLRLLVIFGTCQEEEEEIYLFMTCASAAGTNAGKEFDYVQRNLSLTGDESFAFTYTRDSTHL